MEDSKIIEAVKVMNVSGQLNKSNRLKRVRKTHHVEYLKNYFKNGHRFFCTSYRRKTNGEFRQVVLELARADNYTDDNQTLFLYLRSIEEESVE